MNINDLDRFIIAQEETYKLALKEIKNGHKENHWIWFIFPELKILGKSDKALYYGIKDLYEARRYLKNDYLRHNLIEISEALLNLESNNPNEILDYPDDLKVKSCMTLFHYADPSIKIFKRVLDKFYNGEFDTNTIEFIEKDC